MTCCGRPTRTAATHGRREDSMTADMYPNPLRTNGERTPDPPRASDFCLVSKRFRPARLSTLIPGNPLVLAVRQGKGKEERQAVPVCWSGRTIRPIREPHGGMRGVWIDC
jgi:hypothetical protein